MYTCNFDKAVICTCIVQYNLLHLCVHVFFGRWHTERMKDDGTLNVQYENLKNPCVQSLPYCVMIVLSPYTYVPSPPLVWLARPSPLNTQS